MEVQIVAKELIKPSSLTINTFNLSFVDQQFYGAFYNKLFFFYKNSSVNAIEDIISERTRCLKSSLSEVLTVYYPLAGKTKDKYSVYIGQDDGAEFIEARVDGTLSQFLVEPEINLFLAQLVSSDNCESAKRPLLIIQASFFSCGGLAIGINMCHRVADAASFTCFMNAWAGTAIGNHYEVAKPDFSGSLFFPPSDQFVGAEALQDPVPGPNLVARRFVFSASHIIGLQEKATKIGTKAPSRVQTISAFLWRIGMKMSISEAGGYGVPSTLIMPLNLRNVLPPPICDQSLGNLLQVFMMHNNGTNMELSILIGLVRGQIIKLQETYQNKICQGEKNFIGFLQGSIQELMEIMFQQDVRRNFVISSWCRFPLYNANFGWGKPAWVACYGPAANNMLMMDTADGTGIEAWVCLPEDDMVVFASDEELLSYAALDPSVG